MGKYGQRTEISDELEKLMLILAGEAGIGKTTTMAEFCEKYYGDDGYIILDIGKEQGMDALDGYIAETCEDYDKYNAVTMDIIENKKTDYPDLKLLVIDTLDQLVDIYTPHVIDLYNKLHRGEKGFKKAETLNAAWGGFGAGEDKVSELILERIWELKKVGVGVWFCGHVKMRNKVDSLTQTEYSLLSTNLSQRIFEAFKTKAHVVGIACIDRTIEEESTGRKNIVTKQEITKSKVKKENRKIVFRDDSYSVDAKSRLRNITPEIPLDADALHKALTDAIKASKRSRPKSSKRSVRKKENEISPAVTDESELLFDVHEETVNEIDEVFVPTVVELQDKFKACTDKDVKTVVRKFVKAVGNFAALNDEQRVKAWNMLDN